jgi:hypothetical protein
MATKRFKKLPKDSQRAAFAQMDEDGTRQRGGGNGGGVVVKTLKPSSAKMPHIKTSDQKAMLDKSLYQYGKADKENKDRMMSGLEFGEIRAEQNLKGLKGQKTFDALRERKNSKEFLSTARAFKIKTRKK